MSNKAKRRHRIRKRRVSESEGVKHSPPGRYHWGAVFAAAGAGILLGGLVVAVLTDSKLGSAQVRSWVGQWNRGHNLRRLRAWGDRLNRSQQKWRNRVAERMH